MKFRADLMKFRAIKLLTQKTAVSRITPVRDLIPLVISRASAALIVVRQGLVASSFAS